MLNWTAELVWMLRFTCVGWLLQCGHLLQQLSRLNSILLYRFFAKFCFLLWRRPFSDTSSA